MYKIIYENGEVFKGGKPGDSKWGEITHPIKKLEYKLGNKKIILENYEAYNHLVERVNLVLSPEQFIRRVILLGKKDNNVLKFIFDLKKRDLIVERVEFGKEYNDKPASGWKEGILDCQPKYQII